MNNADLFTRENYANKLLRMIRARIVHGEYKSGEILRETQVSKEWNVSRTPVREALRALEQQQLLERMTNGSYQVTTLSVEYIGHFYDTVRILLDYSMSHFIDLSEPDKRQMEKMIRQMEESIQKTDFDAYIQMMNDIILFLVTKTGNPIIEKITRELIPIGSRIMWAAVTNAPDIPERLMRSVKKIYEKILEKNSQEAIVLFHSTVLLAKEMTVEKLSIEEPNR
ncbi:MAG: GntR family transcriptional regulator [Thermodesulfobacteriota bacterium]